MENNIKEILKLYKTIIENKSINSLSIEEAWSEKTSGLVTKLEDTFEDIINEFESKLSSVGCNSTYTSGFDPTRKNVNSKHKVGKAVDVRTYDHSENPTPPYLTKECVQKALKLCGEFTKKYPSFFCKHEQNRSQSSSDFTVPHFHIQWDGTTTPENKEFVKTEKPTDTNLIEPKKDSNVDLGNLLFGKLNENFVLGKKIQYGNDYSVIPSNDNTKIYSPINGFVDNTKHIPGCTNQLIIKGNNKSAIILYCGITNPYLKQGTKINIGDLIGVTDKDVNVYLFDARFNKVGWETKNALSLYQSEISNTQNKSMGKNKGKDDDDDDSKSKPTSFTDPITSALFPPRLLKKGFDLIFKDKRDRDGKLLQRRMKGPKGEKVTKGWIFGKKENDTQNLENSIEEGVINTNFIDNTTQKTKKLNENIERIKKLLN